MESEIRETLSSYRIYMAEWHLLATCTTQTCLQPTAEAEKRATYLKRQLRRIEAWMMLLSDDERFVVEQHLIAGIDIPRIVVMYEERWGNEFAKTERTIKGYQKQALLKIGAFEQQIQDEIDTAS